MAIYDSVSNSIYEAESLNNGENKFKVSWEGKSGKNVEDYITRKLQDVELDEIVSGEYNTDNETLTLNRRSGKNPVEVNVSVLTPTYLYGIILYGIRICDDKGKVLSTNTSSTLLTLYRQGRKIQLGVAIRSVAERSGNQTTISKQFDTTINMITSNQAVRFSKEMPIYPTSHEYFLMDGTNLVLTAPEDKRIEDAIAWVDVTEMFKKSFKNCTFVASFKQLDNETQSIKTYSHTLGMTITNEVINLTYNGDIVISNNYIPITFDPSSTDTSQYRLVIFNGTEKTINNPGDMQISNLHSGLNQIQVKAVNVNNPDVYTDWFYVDIIYTEGVSDTIVAVNGVSKGITNNGVATLYELMIYSPKQEEIQIITYLDDEEPDNDNPTPNNIIKSEFINPSQYKIETNTLKSTYKKYIEINSDNAIKFLVVKIGENQFYKFYTPYEAMGEYYNDPFLYKRLEVEAIIEEYTYIRSYPTNYNFDLVSGYINNLFVTKNYATPTTPANVSESIESSDGWLENEGRVYFKMSAQPNTLFKTSPNLNLGNNFTIELGLKSYNVSNIDEPVMTLGKLQLRPTMLCWDVDRSAYDDEKEYTKAFLKRVSKFQEGVETHITITVDSNWTLKKNSNEPNQVYYPDFLGDNQNAFDTQVGKYSHNLMRIYINGVIDRELFLEDSELQNLKNATLEINPKGSDVDFYLFRVYNNNSLGFNEVIRNYIAFLPEKTGRNSKEDIYNKNDILDDNGVISWEKCRNKVNTLLFVFPAGGKFPNRFWGGDDGFAEEDIDKNLWTTLFINYADPEINVKYGGRLNKLQVKGQGSSAMRYLIWNVNSSLNKHKDANDNKIKSKFLPNGLLNPTSIPENYTGVEALQEISGKYVMPMYSDKVDRTEYGYTKMVGKVNYASSMQSHKIGACKLYDDAYKASVKSTLPSGGLKAVHEEPFLYFYIEHPTLTNEQCAELTWEELLTMTDMIKFMGFLTWGPGKGDDTCSGYDEDITPEYLLLEGGENGDNSVNFLVPWHALQRLNVVPGTQAISYNDLESQPVCSKEVSKAQPEANLLIDDESVVYMESGAWDIDYGVDEVKKGKKGNDVAYYKFADGVTKSPGGNAKSSLLLFREFYDLVYKYDFTFILEPSNVKQPDANWDINKKHVITSTSFTVDGINSQPDHKSYDVYRYDRINDTWVPAGLYYNLENKRWERLNYREMEELQQYGVTSSAQVSILRRALKLYFTDNISNYVDIIDIAFHQAFIKLLSGTDNRAKNTYYQIIGPIYQEVDKVDAEGNPVYDKDGKQETEFIMSEVNENTYKIRLLGDDLDTVLAIDNNGLQSKFYNLIEDSYDESLDTVWGDLGNLFFRMFDICYEGKIKELLTNIMKTTALSASSVNSTGTYFYNTFFKVQEDFPAIAYNHTAKIYYENASLIKEVGKNAAVGQGYTFNYKHNDAEPIEQSHGSSIESERLFMKERLAFLAGYANAGLDGYIATGSSAGDGASIRLKLDFVPYQDFYPIYQFGTSVDAGFKSFGDLQPATDTTDTFESIQKYSEMRKLVALKDHEYTTYITQGSSTAINQGIYQINMYKSLNVTGLTVPDLTGSFERTVDFEIDNNNLTDSFFNGWSKFTMNSNSAQFPVIQSLKLKQVTLPDTLSLKTYYKLQTLDLTGSTTKYVEFPQTGNLRNVILPSSITEFRIYNNPGLESVQIVAIRIDQNKNTIIEEDISNLKTVYIDCSKCGAFDVAEFCEKLTQVSSLEEITLVNAKNLKMTEATISTLASLKCRFTGSFHIVNDIKVDNPSTVAISFATIEQLVNKFGIIDYDGTENNVRIKYQPKDIYEEKVSCSEIIYLYLNADETEAKFQNAFGLTIEDGNNVAILNEKNPFDPSITGRLNISYSINSSSGVSRIDSKTGIITITGTSTKEDIIYISITTDSGIEINKTCKLICSWVAPQIGDFAYADGSFSPAYSTSKTLVGIVYDKKVTESGNNEKGTVYIIGKEYAYKDGMYTGINYNGANLNSTSTTAQDIYCLQRLLEIADLKNYQSTDESINGMSEIPTITEASDSTLNALKNVNKSGKEDTMKYVKHVAKFLEKLRSLNVYNTLYNTATLRIESLDNLIKLLEELSSSNFLSNTYDNSGDYALKNSKYNRAVLYPYFYSMYLYEPKVKDNEKLDEQYLKNNWYAPSAGELGLVLYCRALSVSANFGINNMNNNVNTKVTEDLAIFSKAFSTTLGTVSVWQDLFNPGDNIVTNISTTTGTDNYGYSIYTYSNSKYAGWVYGMPGYDVTGSWDGTSNANHSSSIWRLNDSHKGIPFTLYNYAKPNV